MSRTSSKRNITVGVDVGGTFTDVACFDPDTGAITRSKVHTTPAHIVTGQIAGINALGIDTQRIKSVLNGTTVVTNALLTHSGRPTAMIMSAGFEDVLETGRERRVGGGLHMYDLSQAGPVALTPRFLRFPIAERVGADGQVLVPLKDAEVEEIADKIIELGVRVIAVCCLFSYLNPSHERRIKSVLLARDPTLAVTLSSDVAPEMREYERASTTFIDAFTADAFHGYIKGLGDALQSVAQAPDVYIMQSNGGLVPADPALVRPVHIVESGPAAGVVAAAFVGRLAGYKDIIAFDVGGTTAKACLLRDGEPGTTAEFKVEGYYPINAASIDLVEIGTGGGSIAWIDAGGALRVGPQSAGATPGPACYGFGGTKPTVTDANLVLGRLSANTFLGGECTLDEIKAREAIRTSIAGPLAMSIEAAAEGILTIANTQMAAAIQLISTRKGYDPRDFVLVAFGGAGPLQAAEIAREVGIRKILVPQGPGTLSALGLLVADLRADAARTFMVAKPEEALQDIEAAFTELERVTTGRIRLQGAEVRIQRSLDVRYVGQRWELTIPAAAGEFSESVWKQVVQDFHAAHQRSYLFNDPTGAVELIKLRVEARVLTPHPPLTEEALSSGDAGARASHRDLVVGGRVMRCAIVHREELRPGLTIEGPAVINDMDSTIWLPPDMSARVDGYRNLLVEDLFKGTGAHRTAIEGVGK